MREILFRGKRKDNGKWIEGAFLHLRVGRDYICDGSVWIGTLQPYKEEVDAKTVGQYTGLTDKNGKKIFEGDIVNIEYLETTVKNAVIEYVGASFYGTTEFDSWELNDYCWLEVIGNIHDNPEIMEEKV